MIEMTLDAIVIADSGSDSLSGTNPLKLKIEDRTADIQVVNNFLDNNGKIHEPIQDDGVASWDSALYLNGIYITSYLLKKNINAELINSFYNELDRFNKLLSSNPKVVIISTTFITGKKNLAKLTSDIRKVAPDVTIIAGGPLVYMSFLLLKRSQDGDYDTHSAKNDFLFLEVNNEPSVDIYITSQCGEQILYEVLKRVQDSGNFDDIPNCAWLAGNTYSFTRQIDDINDKKDLSILWSDLPETIYDSGVVPMQASTGCPYNCSFCNFVKNRSMNRIIPIDSLIDEMKSVRKRGARYVWFVDDNFRLGKEDLAHVCHRFIEESVDLSWMTFVRASTLENIEPEVLREAGCIEVQLGLESADNMILKNMNKKSTPKLYEHVLKKLLSVGINCSCYFIFGFPGETLESIRNTRDFIEQFDTNQYEGSIYWSLFPFIFSPLSPIYEKKARQQFDLTGYLYHWQHATMNSDQAREHVLKTFLDIENSGPMYRGDNQDYLRSLKPETRKNFESTRHHLSKLSITGKLESKTLYRSFQEVFSGKS